MKASLDDSKKELDEQEWHIAELEAELENLDAGTDAHVAQLTKIEEAQALRDELQMANETAKTEFNTVNDELVLKAEEARERAYQQKKEENFAMARTNVALFQMYEEEIQRKIEAATATRDTFDQSTEEEEWNAANDKLEAFQHALAELHIVVEINNNNLKEINEAEAKEAAKAEEYAAKEAYDEAKRERAYIKT